MDYPPRQPPTTNAGEEARIRAEQELEGVLKALKEARKCLRRDWEHLTPRERSAQSRIVKELEQQKQALEDEIEMSPGDY